VIGDLFGRGKRRRPTSGARPLGSAANRELTRLPRWVATNQIIDAVNRRGIPAREPPTNCRVFGTVGPNKRRKLGGGDLSNCSHGIIAADDRRARKAWQRRAMAKVPRHGGTDFSTASRPTPRRGGRGVPWPNKRMAAGEVFGDFFYRAWRSKPGRLALASRTRSKKSWQPSQKRP